MSKYFHEDELKDARPWHMPLVSGPIANPREDEEEEAKENLPPAEPSEEEPPTLKLPTAEEIEAMQQQAYEEGRREGYEKGLEEGRQAGLTEMQAKARQFDNLIQTLQRPLEQLDDEVEQQFSELALSFAQCLLKRELSLDSRHIRALLQEVLGYLPMNERNIRVRLNPADIDLLQQSKASPDEEEWKALSDPAVTQGGCIVESENTRVDASLESRLNQLMDQLFEDLARDHTASET